MAQEPNVEITAGEKPRPVPEPGPAVKWLSGKPGVPKSPADWPRDGGLGAVGPDPGWGFKVLNAAELPDDDPRLRKVVAGLMLARAAANGRAPIPQDVEVALILCGYFDGAPDHLIDRRNRWLAATPYERRRGETAVADVDRDLLARPPEDVAFYLRRTDLG